MCSPDSAISDLYPSDVVSKFLVLAADAPDLENGSGIRASELRAVPPMARVGRKMECPASAADGGDLHLPRARDESNAIPGRMGDDVRMQMYPALHRKPRRALHAVADAPLPFRSHHHAAVEHPPVVVGPVG